MTCEIKVLILLYASDKKAYLGFVPNNQTGFVDRLRKVIQQKQGIGRQAGVPVNPAMQGNMPQQSQQGSMPQQQQPPNPVCSLSYFSIHSS